MTRPQLGKVSNRGLARGKIDSIVIVALLFEAIVPGSLEILKQESGGNKHEHNQDIEQN
jgi:hypothetical protein